MIRVTTKEQFKEAIDSAIDDNSQGHGHWIAPDGHALTVVFAHELSLNQVLLYLLHHKKISDHEFERYSRLSHREVDNLVEINNFLYKKGWIRGVKSGDTGYYANGGDGQRPTHQQRKWLKDYGIETHRTVLFLPRGFNIGGVEVIYSADDVLEENVNPKQEKQAKFFISAVWKHMEKEDRFNPYQFSLWMDAEEHLQRMKERLAREMFPNEDEPEDNFFRQIIVPTLEKLEAKHYEKLAGKMDSEDPLFVLKSIVKGKSYEHAKRSLFRSQAANAPNYKPENVSEEDINTIFRRLFLLAMGQTMYEDVSIAPYLSTLRNPSPTNDRAEELFIQHFAGWKANKFPDTVKVWRGTNSPLHKIRPGDFVTLDKDYAHTYISGDFGAVVGDTLPSNTLKVFKMDIGSTGLVYWPEGHSIKKFTGHVPTFREFWKKENGTQQLNESANIDGKVIINVDIQPDYEKAFGFKPHEWTTFLNESYDACNQMVFLYNGSETVGRMDEDEYKMWLTDCGLDEHIVDQAIFFDKGYAFFRDCMDYGIDEDDITDCVKFMIANDIHDARDMTAEMWLEFAESKPGISRDEIIGLIRNKDALLTVPDLMNFLKHYNGIVLTGGGINECLREVEIALKVLGKNYQIISEFTY